MSCKGQGTSSQGSGWQWSTTEGSGVQETASEGSGVQGSGVQETAAEGSGGHGLGGQEAATEVFWLYELHTQMDMIILLWSYCYGYGQIWSPYGHHVRADEDKEDVDEDDGKVTRTDFFKTLLSSGIFVVEKNPSQIFLELNGITLKWKIIYTYGTLETKTETFTCSSNKAKQGRKEDYYMLPNVWYAVQSKGSIREKLA
ncbi:hypothetical protein L1987_40886 [Smallanthus sonchifolius]|uniref:Uncharacterized protein n=1 Tax=Smallanthus sonchifolius TaxID=185202 RepID=A0ACB9GU00_9ASTR|nr:hypothetical protein L1987_40886 [Smallanthus sonchifolius]